MQHALPPPQISIPPSVRDTETACADISNDIAQMSMHILFHARACCQPLSAELSRWRGLYSSAGHVVMADVMPIHVVVRGSAALVLLFLLESVF